MRCVIEFDILDSTNTYAKSNGHLLEDKTVILAHAQTAGRGRHGRKWQSELGGLYFTLLLKPVKVDFLPNLTQLMALSVAFTLESVGVQPEIKWPNDVLINGKKICGILSEGISRGSAMEALAVGVGVNIGQENLDTGISLKQLGICADAKSFLDNTLNYFFNFYDIVLQRGFGAIAAGYKKYFLAAGKNIELSDGTKGFVKGLDEEGRLVLAGACGERKLIAGEIL